MENVNETIIQLIANEVCGGTLCLPLQAPFSDEFSVELYNVSKAHSVAHIVGGALINNGLLADTGIDGIFRDKVYGTLFRYENLAYVLEKVCGVLEKAKMPYIPLKGSVIKELYPKPWLRTGCDIDILVHEQDVDAAAAAIAEELGYEIKGRGNHDISILATEGIYVELHFSLLEETKERNFARVLNDVWYHASPCENGGFRYELDDAMFYFYHIAHMAKHFIDGGCGLRPFLDLWLMERSRNYHTDKTKRLLKKGKLVDFAEAAVQLSEAWFSGKEHNKTTRLMAEFVMSGGCFGTAHTKMLSYQQRSGGRLKYVLSRIFVPYNDLKGQYPIIKKYRFLTPFCEICRLFSLMLGKKKKFRKNYLNNMKNVPDEHIDNVNLLFERVGLK